MLAIILPTILLVALVAVPLAWRIRADRRRDRAVVGRAESRTVLAVSHGGDHEGRPRHTLARVSDGATIAGSSISRSSSTTWTRPTSGSDATTSRTSRRRIRQQRSLNGVLHATEAFGVLGDRSTIEQCMRVAEGAV